MFRRENLGLSARNLPAAFFFSCKKNLPSQHQQALNGIEEKSFSAFVLPVLSFAPSAQQKCIFM